MIGRLDEALQLGSGFLPRHTPLHQLPPPFEAISQACQQLPERYHGAQLDCRPWLHQQFDQPYPQGSAALEQASLPTLEALMTQLSLLGHAYRWQRTPPGPSAYAATHVDLPLGLAELWGQVARRLQVPRVGLFYTMIACNWKLQGVEPDSPYRLEDLQDERLDLIHSWLLPPEHEALRTFVVSALLVEARGQAVLRCMRETYECLARDDAQEATFHLMVLSAHLLAIGSAFHRGIRTARLKPQHFSQLVQPTMVWLIDGLEGASGPQCCTMQLLDSFFGVPRAGHIGQLLLQSRTYMLPRHRSLIEAVDGARDELRNFVARADSPRLLETFNRCLQLLQSWRQSHQQRGKLYIAAADDPPYVSTGLLVQDGQQKADHFERSMEEHMSSTRQRQLDNPWQGKEWSLDCLFRFLTREQRQQLARHTRRLRFAAGERIFSQGDLFPGLYVLRNGSATVLRRQGKEERVVGRLGVDEVFGEMSLVDNLPASASIVADVDLEVDQVPLEIVYDLMASQPQAEGGFYLALAQLISRRLRESGA